MPYLDGLPIATVAAPADTIPIAQGGTGVPGSATQRQISVENLLNGGGSDGTFNNLTAEVSLTAPTLPPGTDTTGAATTAFVGAAVAVETTRAEAAEAILTTAAVTAQTTANAALPLAGGTVTGSLTVMGSITSEANLVATPGAAFVALTPTETPGGFMTTNAAGDVLLNTGQSGGQINGSSLNIIDIGTIAPAAIIGVTTGSNAAAGQIGEVLSADAETVAIANATFTNIVTLNLTPGDWDVTGVMQTNPAGTTTQALIAVGISATSATMTPIASGFANETVIAPSSLAAATLAVSAPVQRVNVTTTTTVYLVGFVNYAVSTLTASGFIRARRMR